MKKSILILALCFVMMFVVAAVSAQEAEVPADEAVAEEAVAEEAAGFKVTYLENDCLAEVPTDENAYAAVLFEPVQYKDYLIFYGWDINNDGVADFGYNYDKFNMPESDVELKAICIGAAWGGKTCKGCHLHGVPNKPYLDYFTYEIAMKP